MTSISNIHYIGLCNNTNAFNIETKRVADELIDNWNIPE
jgi:hypothetical protein